MVGLYMFGVGVLLFCKFTRCAELVVVAVVEFGICECSRSETTLDYT